MALRAVAVEARATFSANGHRPDYQVITGPHHADCPQAVYLDQQVMLWRWNKERYRDYDLSDRLFWKTFGEKAVPSCTCEHRQVENDNIVPLPFREMPQPFELHYQAAITAPILGQLRHRIAMVLATETGDLAFHFMELGDTHKPGIEHALGKNTRECLQRLRAFEEHAATSLRHRRR